MKVVDSTEPPSGESETPPRTCQLIRWSGVTRLDISVSTVIEAASSAGLRCAVVLGYDESGEEYFRVIAGRWSRRSMAT